MAAVASIKNIDDKQKYAPLPPLGQINKPVTIPKVKLKYIKMLDNFANTFPVIKRFPDAIHSSVHALPVWSLHQFIEEIRVDRQGNPKNKTWEIVG